MHIQKNCAQLLQILNHYITNLESEQKALEIFAEIQSQEREDIEVRTCSHYLRYAEITINEINKKYCDAMTVCAANLADFDCRLEMLYKLKKDAVKFDKQPGIYQKILIDVLNEMRKYDSGKNIPKITINKSSDNVSNKSTIKSKTIPKKKSSKLKLQKISQSKTLPKNKSSMLMNLMQNHNPGHNIPPVLGNIPPPIFNMPLIPPPPIFNMPLIQPPPISNNNLMLPLPPLPQLKLPIFDVNAKGISNNNNLSYDINFLRQSCNLIDKCNTHSNLPPSAFFNASNNNNNSNSNLPPAGSFNASNTNSNSNFPPPRSFNASNNNRGSLSISKGNKRNINDVYCADKKTKLNVMTVKQCQSLKVGEQIDFRFVFLYLV